MSNSSEVINIFFSHSSWFFSNLEISTLLTTIFLPRMISLLLKYDMMISFSNNYPDNVKSSDFNTFYHIFQRVHVIHLNMKILFFGFFLVSGIFQIFSDLKKKFRNFSFYFFFLFLLIFSSFKVSKINLNLVNSTHEAK